MNLYVNMSREKNALGNPKNNVIYVYLTGLVIFFSRDILTYRFIHRDRRRSCKGSSEAECFARYAAIPEFFLKPQFFKQR